MIEIAGVKPSADIRAEFAQAGEPVMLAFSGGKDAICAWVALRDAGVDVIPYHLYFHPHLSLVNENLDYFEDYFGTRIARYPHPSVYRWLSSWTYQEPGNLAVIQAADLGMVNYQETIVSIAEDLGIDPMMWVADGVRAPDSIVRRISIVKHGPVKNNGRKFSPVWDWTIADVRECFATGRVPGTAGPTRPIRWPRDYELFDRSFDGLDYRFIGPLKKHIPEDYERLRELYPMIEAEIFRHEHLSV